VRDRVLNYRIPNCKDRAYSSGFRGWPSELLHYRNREFTYRLFDEAVHETRDALGRVDTAKLAKVSGGTVSGSGFCRFPVLDSAKAERRQAESRFRSPGFHKPATDVFLVHAFYSFIRDYLQPLMDR